MLSYLDTTIANLKLQIQGWSTDLANDAGSGAGGTMPDYSLDGRTVSRDAWRAGLQAQIDTALEQLQKLEPFENVSQGW